MAEENDTVAPSGLILKQPVNAETLELLQLRMEANIRKSFLGWVGLPLGGLGIGAIAFAIFVYIPDKVTAFLNEPTMQKQLESRVDKGVQDFVNDSKGGGRIIADEVRKIGAEEVGNAVKLYFTSPTGQSSVAESIKQVLASDSGQKTVAESVRQTLSSDTGQRTVAESIRQILASESGQKTVAATVQAHFETDAGKNRVVSAVDEYLKSADGQQLIVKSVNGAMKQAASNLQSRIGVNETKPLSDLDTNRIEGFGKEGMDAMFRALNSDRAAKILKDGSPVALVASIRRDSAYFDRGVTEEYLSQFRQKFGAQFRFVVFADKDGTFLAATTPDQVNQHLGQGLIDLMNATPRQKSREEVAALLHGMFGESLNGALIMDQKLIDALASTAWKTPDELDAELAVVDGKGKPVGTTSRRILIQRLLNS